jgi:hypothetical protein
LVVRGRTIHLIIRDSPDVDLIHRFVAPALPHGD